MPDARDARETAGSASPPAGEAPVLELVDFAVRRPSARLELRVPRLELLGGEAAALLGPSGSGKTTLLLAMLGLLPRGEAEARGEVRVAGAPLPAPGSDAWRARMFADVALVMQDARAALDPLQTLGRHMQDATGKSLDACAAALAQLGIDEPGAMLRRYPHQVSGGQAQRVLLAVALARRPRLIVADEPTASLDGARSDALVRALQVLREETGCALLAATHDLGFARAIGARPLAVLGDSVAEGWPPACDLPEPPPAPPVRAEPVLAARGLGLRYGARWAFRGVDLDLAPGEVVAVLGSSGAGKTSLARVLAGLLPPTEGRVVAAGRSVDRQYSSQDAYGSLTPGRSVGRLARETLAPGVDLGALAADLGLAPEHLARAGAELSGGERRRAALLRSLTVRPRVLILDEPTASLDRATSAAVMAAVLAILAKTQMALILITHDEELAAAVAHRTLRLEEGRPC
jgi:peptide/nickel transport system ATP-binding protein